MAGRGGLLMLENFIGGKFLPCSSYLDSYDPSTGEVYCRVPNSGKEEVEAAVEAARAAFPGWSSRSPQERSQVLQRLADLLEQSLEELAQAESKDQGKTITLARTMDIPRAVQNFRFFASSILHHTSECTQMDHLGCLHYTVRAPVGIAALISPWNLPLYLLTWKMAPAIAAGNTVIAKPSELTSVTAWMMCRLLEKAGFIKSNSPHSLALNSLFEYRANLHKLNSNGDAGLMRTYCGLKTGLLTSPMVGFMVANQCTFHTPVSFPQIPVAALAVEKVGRSSVHYRLALFPPKPTKETPCTSHRDLSDGFFFGHPKLAQFASLACTTGSSVHVFVNPATSKPVGLPEDFRRGLLRLMSPAPG